MSNYPPGVTGNEPEITGIWPCAVCGGSGGDRDEDGFNPCWMCKGTGIHPEDAPDCPNCNATHTEFLAHLPGPQQAEISEEYGIPGSEDWSYIFCPDCKKVSGDGI